MAIPLTYNLRSLFVRKSTTIATAVGIGLVVFVLSGSMMLGAGIRGTLNRNGSPDRAIVLRKGSDVEMQSGVDSSAVSIIVAQDQIASDPALGRLASPEVVVVVALDKPGGEGLVSNVLVRGVTAMASAVRPEVRVIEGRMPQPGTAEAMVGKGLVGQFVGMEMGAETELRKNRPVKIVGVFEARGSSLESEVWADIDVVRSAFGRESSSSAVTVVLSSRDQFQPFKDAIESNQQLDVGVMRETTYYEKLSEGTADFISIMGGAVSFLFSVGAMIGAMITMYGAVSQRAREVGTLRALGFSRPNILVAFVLESTALALLGAAGGALCALLLSTVKFSMMNFATWQEISFSFDASSTTVILPIVAGAGMGILGGFLPAIQAARLSPVQAMRG